MPDFLYHYTNIPDFINILKSGIFHSKHILSQKDNKEMQEFIKRLKNRLTYERNNSDSEKVKQILKRSTENIDFYMSNHKNLNLEYPISIISFSEIRDDKYQWKYYSNNKNGCCLSFKFKALKEACTPIKKDCPLLKSESITDELFKENKKLEKCIYDDKNKEEIINCIVSNLLNGKNYGIDLKLKTTKIFSEKASIFKNKKFEKENEWRLIFCQKYNLCLLDYIPKYYDIKIDFTNCLNEIIINSKTNYETEQKEIKNILKELNFDLTKIKITKSLIN